MSEGVRACDRARDVRREPEREREVKAAGRSGLALALSGECMLAFKYAEEGGVLCRLTASRAVYVGADENKRWILVGGSGTRPCRGDSSLDLPAPAGRLDCRGRAQG